MHRSPTSIPPLNLSGHARVMENIKSLLKRIRRGGRTRSGQKPKCGEDEGQSSRLGQPNVQSLLSEVRSIAMHCRVLTSRDEEAGRFEKPRKGVLKKALKKAWKKMKGISEDFGTESEEFHFDDRYSEFEESEAPPRYRPDSLKALCRATKFTEAEIKRIYRGFKAECPTGVVREETFKGIYSQFFPQGANASQYAHYVFNTLDHNRSGILSFEDFVTGLSILARGSLEEKLKWTFSLYDINGDGCITKDEMTDIITAIYDLMGKHIEPIDEATLKERVDRIFQKMDMNQDGVVTMEEFLDCCTTDDDISASMEVFDFSF